MTYWRNADRLPIGMPAGIDAQSAEPDDGHGREVHDSEEETGSSSRRGGWSAGRCPVRSRLATS